jgi:endonuclease IV
LSKNVDRHENLGFGKIGLNGLKQVIKIAKDFDIAIILETPKSSIEEINLIKNI